MDTDLKNYEKYKYKISKYDLNESKKQIEELFEKYFINPINLRKIINYQTESNILRITYICMSPESFINICNLFYLLNKSLDLSNVRIVYFGIKDIFQKSHINDQNLNKFRQIINSTFKFVEHEYEESKITSEQISNYISMDYLVYNNIDGLFGL